MFRYKYADLGCDYCLYRRQCEVDVCPFIMDCLDDLQNDKAFHQAVGNAETCDSNHKQTLIMLKERFAGSGAV